MAKVRVNWGRLEEGENVFLFGVYNTSSKCLYVLARDADEAMNIARTANHVYGTTQDILADHGRHVFKTLQIPNELRSHCLEIERAVSQRIRGTLHIIGDVVAVGDEVIKL